MGEAHNKISSIREDVFNKHLKTFLSLKPPRFDGNIEPRAVED